MSFNADRKRDHESLAEKALARLDYARAFFHTAKAADFGLNLCELTDGRLARAHLADALELLDIAAALKEKAGKVQGPAVPRRVVETLEEESADRTSSSPWQLHERPDLRLQDVAGLADVKQALREDVINVFSHPDVYQRFKVEGGGGVLMFGPPGNGKTYIARAIAGELDAAFFPIEAARIKDKWHGETEKNLKRVFAEAGEHERAVLFLDEADALLSRRGNQKVAAVTQFLTLADGIVKAKNCLLLLGATNKPWTLDPAVLRPGRFGRQIYVGLPDGEARQAILRRCLSGVPTQDAFPYDRFAEATSGFSGADVAELCRRAKKSAIRRQIASGVAEILSESDLQHALEVTAPSVRPSDLEKYEQWNAEVGAEASPTGSTDA